MVGSFASPILATWIHGSIPRLANQQPFGTETGVTGGEERVNGRDGLGLPFFFRAVFYPSRRPLGKRDGGCYGRDIITAPWKHMARDGTPYKESPENEGIGWQPATWGIRDGFL